MKKIEAIFRRERLAEVRRALEEQGYPGTTIYEVRGYGKQEPITQQWRGREYQVELLPYVKLEIVAMNDDVYRLASAIVRSARTGELGDGKIFISPVEDAVRIRDSEQGGNAV